MDSYKETKKQWDELQRLPWPKSASGADIGDSDLGVIDTNISGCVHTYIKTKKLDKDKLDNYLNWSLQILEEHFNDIPEDAKEYFGKLMSLGKLVAKNN